MADTEPAIRYAHSGDVHVAYRRFVERLGPLPA